MAELASPFTIEDVVAVLERDDVPYLRQDGEAAVLVQLCCGRVPHELRIAVDAEHGFCTIYQHNLGLCSAAVAGADRVGEACRFALMLNASMLFGSFMLGGHQQTGLSFGVDIPIAGAVLSAAQLQQTIATLCAEIDDVYPLMQRVLWGALSAEAAIAEVQARLQGDTGNDGHADDPGDHDRDVQLDGGTAALSSRGEAGRPLPDAALDQLDDAFLASCDQRDPFSAALAEAILRQREARQQGPERSDAGA